MNRITVKGLKYVFCDDWLIFAIDRNKRLYFVNTEMWPEWLDVPEKEQHKPNSVRKYMLPVARQDWDSLSWRPAEDDDGVQVVFSYFEYYRDLLTLRLYYRPRFLFKLFMRKLKTALSR